MSLDELKTVYPGCPRAVEFGESEHASHVWEASRRFALPPAEVVEVLKESALESAMMLKLFGKEEASAKAAGLFPQMEHPDFLRYVKAKLGAV